MTPGGQDVPALPAAQRTPAAARTLWPKLNKGQAKTRPAKEAQALWQRPASLSAKTPAGRAAPSPRFEALPAVAGPPVPKLLLAGPPMIGLSRITAGLRGHERRLDYLPLDYFPQDCLPLDYLSLDYLPHRQRLQRL